MDDVPLLDPVSDGERVYAASTATRLSAHELRTGRPLWSVPLPSDATASPAVADGLVYVGTFEGHLLCVDAATGQTLWTFQAEDQLAGSPNVVALQGGRKLVLVSSWDTHVYAVLGGREGGSLLWKQATQDRVNGMPVVAGGRVYVGGCDAVLYAFALEDGSPLWQTGVQSYIPANVALSAGAGVVVAGLHEDANALVAIDTGTGKLRWQTPKLGFPYTAAPAVHSTGLVVAGSRDRQVRAHHLRDGSPAWSAAIGASVDVPVSLAPQHVVLPTSDARLLLLSIHDGSTLQTLSLPVRSETAPALAGQWVIVASRDGRLHAFAPAAKAVPQ